MGILALALSACNCEDEGPKPETVAASVGKGYYEKLIKGDLDGYAAGIDGTQTAPAEYRKMLADNAQAFLQRQESLHQGIKAVETDSASFSEKDSTARVFLRLTYGDGAKERVLLPMLCRKGVWYMR